MEGRAVDSGPLVARRPQGGVLLNYLVKSDSQVVEVRGPEEAVR